MILYRVTVRRVYEALVLAPDAETAESFAREISRCEDPLDTEVESHPNSSQQTLPDGWTESTFVYYPGDELITVAEARRIGGLET